MGAQVVCHPPNVGPPMNQRLRTAKVLSYSERALPMCSSKLCATCRETIPYGACAAQNGTDVVQAGKHDLTLMSIRTLKKMCFQTPQSEPLELRQGLQAEKISFGPFQLGLNHIQFDKI